jgi:hypothetical protein
LAGLDIWLFSVTGIRPDIRQDKSGIRPDIRQGKSGIRPDIRQDKSGIRPDIRQGKSGIRPDIRQDKSGIPTFESINGQWGNRAVSFLRAQNSVADPGCFIPDSDQQHWLRINCTA